MSRSALLLVLLIVVVLEIAALAIYYAGLNRDDDDRPGDQDPIEPLPSQDEPERDSTIRRDEPEIEWAKRRRAAVA